MKRFSRGAWQSQSGQASGHCRRQETRHQQEHGRAVTDQGEWQKGQDQRRATYQASPPYECRVENEAYHGFVLELDTYNQSEVTDPSDAALNLLTAEKRADHIEILELFVARLQKIISRLRPKDREAA